VNKTSLSSKLCLDLFVDIADWTINPKNERIALRRCPFAMCSDLATFFKTNIIGF
jgi:hypothetical protein